MTPTKDMLVGGGRTQVSFLAFKVRVNGGGWVPKRHGGSGNVSLLSALLTYWCFGESGEVGHHNS